jgi:transposase
MNESISNDLSLIIAQAIDEIKEEQGQSFELKKINLADLQRRTGISRARLRRLKENGFKDKPHGLIGTKAHVTVLTGYTSVLDDYLRKGIRNSSVCFEVLKEMGYTGSQTTVRDYLRNHQDLMPAKRQEVAPQGNRGRRYSTGPGESYQMDWGFTKVIEKETGNTYNAACFAMICHHCGQRYVEFFPNAKQENLFIGMLHAFTYMGIPKYVLTDNMKSVVLKRDGLGKPIWNLEYEGFMKAVGFQTKLCKPRHPFTKGKVERLIKFVKSNFLAARTFWNVTDLNEAALQWCERQNRSYHKALDMMPDDVHMSKCMSVAGKLQDEPALLFYLCPERRISFDGFVNFEGRRFGVPYRHLGKTVRVSRRGTTLYIFTPDMKQCLTTHEVTWSKRDSFCQDQYVNPLQPEEFPTQKITTAIHRLEAPALDEAFERFNFDQEDLWNE